TYTYSVPSFLTIRPPPRSTLFPYTTLFRSLGTTQIEYQGQPVDLTPPWKRMTMIDAVKEYTGIDFDSFTEDEEAARALKEIGIRSEEHTSELQSRENLVCRLLLEKKKKTHV